MTGPWCASVGSLPACWHGECVNGSRCECWPGWTQTLEVDFWQGPVLREMQVESAACDIPSWLSLDLLSTVSSIVGYILAGLLVISARGRRKFRRQFPSVLICGMCALLGMLRSLWPAAWGPGRSLYLFVFGVTQFLCVAITSNTQVRYLQYLRLQSEAGLSLGARVRMQLVVYARGIKIVQLASTLAIPFLLSSPLVAKTWASRVLFQTGMIIFAMSNLGLSILGGHITYCVMQDLVTAMRCQDGILAIQDTKIYSATKRATKRLTMLFRLSVMMGVFDIGLLALSVSDVGLLLFKFALPIHIFFVQLFYAASRLAAKQRPKARDPETRIHFQCTKVLASNTSVHQHQGLQTSVLGPLDVTSSFDITRTSGRMGF